MTPRMQMIPMIPNEIMESFLASSSMLSCSGVRFSSTSCIIAKIIPNSVCVPVAITTPAPRPKNKHHEGYFYLTGHELDTPFRTSVPMYAMHDRSASATGSAAGAPYPFA